ncbi:hypothetical protein BP5796_11531 [Coleophoma crateriformis]|uniref:AB hydrolase-1 domain-containing protein n=1 Tax=Coleophoma crateriformis TaxID=565419 RepID=A0A3D8QIM9_9HELO|nr:hypothetical protein BP5796_11531 [Coleophoma crateriformis]
MVSLQRIFILSVFHTLVAAGLDSNASTIRWVDCKDNVPSEAIFDSTGIDLDNLPSTLHCGQIDVPMDYAKPLSSNNTITLGLAMYRPKNPKGVIFYNPGGSDPAAVAAWDFALNQTDMFSGLETFDLMMMDVRGTYSSNQLNVSLDAFTTLFGSYPTTLEEFRVMQNASRNMAQSWIDSSSPPGIVQFVGTKEVVQDYERIRQALGYAKIDFIGASYGSFRAAQYAATFPAHVGRFVLDAVTPHGRSEFDKAQDAVAAINRGMLRVDAYCQQTVTCPFHSQGNGSVIKVFQQIVEAAKTTPLNFCINATSCEPIITSYDVRQAVFDSLSGIPDFPQIIQSLAEASEGNGTSYGGGSSDSILGVLAVPLECNDQGNSLTVIKSVLDELMFLDSQLHNFSYFQESLSAGLKNDITGIGMNNVWLLQLACSAWPFPPAPQQPLRLSSPMLLVTADFDADAPTEWTTFAWDQIPNSGLIVRHGDDHVSFQLQHQCSTTLTKEYLRTGALPSPGKLPLISVYAPRTERDAIYNPYSVPTEPSVNETSTCFDSCV